MESTKMRTSRSLWRSRTPPHCLMEKIQAYKGISRTKASPAIHHLLIIRPCKTKVVSIYQSLFHRSRHALWLAWASDAYLGIPVAETALGSALWPNFRPLWWLWRHRTRSEDSLSGRSGQTNGIPDKLEQKQPLRFLSTFSLTLLIVYRTNLI